MIFNLICILQCIGILLIAAECIFIFTKWKTRQHSYLFLYCASTLINSVGYLLEMTAESGDAALNGTKMCYMGKVFIALSLFIFVMNLIGVKVPKRRYALLAGFHMFIFMLVLTCRQQKLYYTSITYVQSGLFPHNEFGHGFFYWIFMGLMICYLISGLVAMVRRLPREKSHENRKIMHYLIACSLIEVAGLCLFLTGISGGYDLTSPAFVIVAILLYIMMLRHHLMNGKDVVSAEVVDALDDGILAIDRWGDIFYYNHSAGNLFPALAENTAAVLAGLDAACANAADLEINHRHYMVEVKQICQDREPVATLYQIADITDRHRFEAELQAQKDLAERANASKSRFVSTVSHEIRTPMNAVVGMTDLLLSQPEELSDRQQKYLRNIQASGKALVSIVNDILDESKLESGKMEIVRAPYVLRSLVSDIMMIIENRIGQKPIRLELDIAQSIPPVLIGDSLRIRQVLINLMNNAVKFTEEGFIRLSIQPAQTEPAASDQLLLYFSVSDSGQGIQADDLDQLGKAFSQVNIERNHMKEGTGLGLSISKELIALMGGTLEVRSVFGQGSEFFFRIPQGIAESMTDTAAQSGNVPVQSEVISAGGCALPVENSEAGAVLVIDDNRMNLDVMSEMLTMLHVRVDTAESGPSALRLLEHNRYILILVDYIMPEMDGLETTKAIRALAVRSAFCAYCAEIPIVAITGDSSEATRTAFLNAGANSVHEKPLSLETLKLILGK